MNQSSQNTQTGLRIALIQARWHGDIVNQARNGFVDEMSRATHTAPQIETFDVPGAFELPLQAQMLARTGRYDAIIACAFVVDGGIYRHDFVAQTVLDALMRAQMETDVPVLSVVLTPHHFHESDKHQQFFLEHFKVKGREAAEACMHVLSLREEIRAVA